LKSFKHQVPTERLEAKVGGERTPAGEDEFTEIAALTAVSHVQ